MKEKTFSHTDASLKRLSLRIIEEEEIEEFNRILREHHPLHSSRSGGETLRYVAEIDGEWVGVLLWGSAAYRLKDRDQWIGWDESMRQRRLKLVVQNRRFLILPGVKLANLASKALAMGAARLAEDWLNRFGYKPLLAETFVDPEQYRGTCYEAAGWQPVGFSKGFGRHRKDFYQAHDKPKQLWLKPLHKNARELLCAPKLSAPYENAIREKASETVVFGVAQMESLWEAMNTQIKDFRRAAGTDWAVPDRAAGGRSHSGFREHKPAGRAP